MTREGGEMATAAFEGLVIDGERVPTVEVATFDDRMMGAGSRR
jgi:hypothetical protein